MRNTMALFRSFFVLSIAATSLSGCLTSSSPPPSVPPTTSTVNTVAQGANSANLEPTLFGGNSIRVPNGPLVNFDYGPDTERYTTANFRSFVRDSPHAQDRAFYRATTSGSGEVYLINSTEDGFETTAAIVERTRPGLVPTSGTATYLGLYTGMMHFDRGGKEVVWGVLDGTVILTANFGANSTISGTISGRERIVVPDEEYEDITLELTSVNGGAFQGTTSGGRRVTTNNSAGADPGTYVGFIVGDTAAEAVGSVIINHTNSVKPHLEVGGFVVGTVSPPMGSP